MIWQTRDLVCMYSSGEELITHTQTAADRWEVGCLPPGHEREGWLYVVADFSLRVQFSVRLHMD